MSESPVAPEERFASVVAALIGRSDVTLGVAEKKRFGSSALTTGGKIFAMLVKGRLVVKLPRQRVDTLLAEGGGERFDPGHGRLMKEWLAVDLVSHERWLPLAVEAQEFVASQR